MTRQLPVCPWCGTEHAMTKSTCEKCGGELPKYVGALPDRYVRADEENLDEILEMADFVRFIDIYILVAPQKRWEKAGG